MNAPMPTNETHGQKGNKCSDAAYTRLTFRMALQLAAPHTWPASILPVLLATAFAMVATPPISVSMVCILLCICILMQASVNTFNDYYDYVKGADSSEDNVEPSDAVLIYNNINPHAALMLAVGFLGAAFALGGYVIWVCGWIPLFIGVIGACVVVLYSAGKTPISYLPIAELVSGIIMGGLIPLACYQALTNTFDLRVLIWSLPVILGIGLIMMTNNSCDIEKDRESNRHTLAVLLGRKRIRMLYHAILLAIVVVMIVIIALWFNRGLIIIPFMVLASYPLINVLMKNPLIPKTRIGAMAQICSVNITLGAFYAAAVLASGFGLVF